MIPVIIRYPDRTERAVIEPCGSRGMYRVSKVKPKQIHMPRAVRVRQILEVVKVYPGLSYKKIADKIGLSVWQVFHIIKEENIDRN